MTRAHLTPAHAFVCGANPVSRDVTILDLSDGARLAVYRALDAGGRIAVFGQIIDARGHRDGGEMSFHFGLSVDVAAIRVTGLGADEVAIVAVPHGNGRPRAQTFEVSARDGAMAVFGASIELGEEAAADAADARASDAAMVLPTIDRADVGARTGRGAMILTPVNEPAPAADRMNSAIHS